MASHYRIGELARACHVSVRTLQRHFQKHYDLTVSEWLHELRLEQARHQLATAESVKAVAYTLGYKRPSHFTRDFKEYYGMPPSAWRAAGILLTNDAPTPDLSPSSYESQPEFAQLFQ